ncbi:SusC/RagA family TonB-linked outer membrane protein [Muricauda sp. TY007]|nr:SusC/RagA family TonB-linked outer membrane protein [Muricauda sp. TY007]NDV15768.1 SusC/RagA family TonB-linked outer membrane protein [Muricauda sp. TY007]
MDYHISGKHIILTKKGNTASPNSAPTPKEKTEVKQQQVEVSGTITDPEGNPLPGVNIIIKGTNQGTMSDPDGKYTIRVQTNDILTFSYVGLKRVEMPVNSSDTLNIQMEEDVMSLEGVELNAGYWKVKDRERTGNISRLSSEEIANQPVPNVMAAAIGRMPGVNIRQNSGLPGGNFRISIRGQNSLRSNANEPLYVIDGIPFTSTSLDVLASATDVFGTGNAISPLNAINPTDIESIEVLKDADATAIYGSRGANGVVLITTKKGGVGETRVDVNFQHGIGKVPHFMDLLNIDQYLEMRREAFANDGVEPRSTDYDVNGIWDPNRNVDWQKRLLGGTAETTNANISISGGSQNTQYVFNGGYYRETTVFPRDFAYQRGSGQLNVNHISENQRFKANFSANFSKDENNLPGQNFTDTALTLPPNAPEPFNEDGSINWANGTWGSSGSPFAVLNRPYKGKTDNLISNVTLSYRLLSDLQFKTSTGYTSIQFNEKFLWPISTNDPTTGSTTGQARHSDSSIYTWIVEPQITYQKRISKGSLNLLLGATFQKDIRESQEVRTYGIGSDALLEDISAATTIRAFNSFKEYRYNAFFGRVNFNWDEKYIINLTGRRDGSSRFGPGKRFGNFGAIGMAWVFSNEGFVKKNVPFLNFGKLRVSYGTTGNDQIPDYGYLETYSSERSYFNGTTLLPSRIANNNYSWEINKKFETGLELGILNNRVNLTTSYYLNRSSNQLVGFALPTITGFNTVQANLPATVQNMGWELGLISRNIESHSGDFNWITSINFTIPQNKLLKYPNLEGSPYANTYVVGKPLSIQKNYKYLGIDPESGVYQFQDVDKDGVISSPNDAQTIVELGQHYYGGVNNSVSFKGLQLDFFFQLVKQTSHSHRGAFLYLPGFVFPGLGNQPVEVLDRWQQPGDQTDIPKFSATDFSQYLTHAFNWNSSDMAKVDASFIRLSNISLSWSLPKSIVHTLRLQQARFYIQGQNLWTITNYRGLDPETGSLMPPLRRITTGVHVTF